MKHPIVHFITVITKCAKLIRNFAYYETPLKELFRYKMEKFNFVSCFKIKGNMLLTCCENLKSLASVDFLPLTFVRYVKVSCNNRE